MLITANGRSLPGRALRVFAGVVGLGMACTGCAQRTAYRYLDLAIRYESGRQEQPALAAFRAAVQVRPDDPFLLRSLARAYSRRGMYAEAEESLRRVLEVEPEYADVFLDMAALSRAQDLPEAAAGWLRQGVAAVPAYMPLNRALVQFYLAHDRSTEALELLQSLAERRPGEAWVHVSLGYLYQQLDLISEAESSFRRAVASDPDLARAHAALGNALVSQGDHASAAEAYREAIVLDPADHTSLNNLAWVYAVQGVRLDEGLQLSRRALQLDPDSPTYLDTLAELYYQLGDREGALAIIRRALAIHAAGPGDPELGEHLRQQLDKFQAARPGKV